MPLWFRVLKHCVVSGFKYLLLLLKYIWTNCLNRRGANTSYSSMITWSTPSCSHTLGCFQVPKKLTPTSINVSNSLDFRFKRTGVLQGVPTFPFSSSTLVEGKYKWASNLLVSCFIIPELLVFFCYRQSEALSTQQHPSPCTLFRF